MSQKVVDRAGRWRNRTVAFRVSEEEAAQIDAFVALSGLSKQEYCASRLLQKEVTVKPSSRLQKNISKQVSQIYRELRRIEQAKDMPIELIEILEVMGSTFAALGIEETLSDTENEARSINQMSRE